MINFEMSCQGPQFQRVLLSQEVADIGFAQIEHSTLQNK